jgi:hypothetical protein
MQVVYYVSCVVARPMEPLEVRMKHNDLHEPICLLAMQEAGATTPPISI